MHASGNGDDSALVSRALEGDEDAFWELARKHERRIRGAIRAYSDSDEEAEDLVTSVLLRLSSAMRAYKPDKGTFKAFLIGVVHNAIRQHIDAKVRRRAHEILESELPEPEQIMEAATASTDISGSVGASGSEAPPEGYRTLLEVTFGGSSPPHQLLVFGFSKLVSEPRIAPRKRGKRRTSGRADAKRIVSELSDIPLRELALLLEERYLRESALPEGEVRCCFEPLHRNMRRKLREVLTEAKTIETYSHMLDCCVGNTVLGDYYTAKRREANISQWWSAVRRRVVSELCAQGLANLAALLASDDSEGPARNATGDCIDKGGRRDG